MNDKLSNDTINASVLSVALPEPEQQKQELPIKLEPQHKSDGRKRKVIVNEQEKSISEWSQITGIGKTTIGERLARGWGAYDAVYAPIGTKLQHDPPPPSGELIVIEGKECLKIPLSRNMFALIDKSDGPAITKFRWYAHRGNKTFYAARREYIAGQGKCVLMHRQLTHFEHLVDHENNNGLDNRRSNLRRATNSQNCSNKDSNNKTGFRGVCQNRNGTRWSAIIKVMGITRFIASFDNPVEAAMAYDAAALESFGEFARLNFPITKSTK